MKFGKVIRVYKTENNSFVKIRKYPIGYRVIDVGFGVSKFFFRLKSAVKEAEWISGARIYTAFN